jgi:hypothetical protein
MLQPNLESTVDQHGDEYPRSRPGVIGYLVFVIAIVGSLLIANWDKVSGYFM